MAAKKDVRQRDTTLNLRVSDGEHEMAHRLAKDEDMPVSMMLRRWIRQRYEARFGEALRDEEVKKSA